MRHVSGSDLLHVWYGSRMDLSDTGTFTWVSLRELFEEVEKSTETLAIMERSSVKVVGRSYGSSKAIPYHLPHTDITLPLWPLTACGTGQRVEGQCLAELEEARN